MLPEITELLKAILAVNQSLAENETACTENIATTIIKQNTDIISLIQKNTPVHELPANNLVNIVLESVSPLKKIATIRLIRTITGFGLADAKNIFDSFIVPCAAGLERHDIMVHPYILKHDSTPLEAELIKQNFEAEGAIVKIIPTSQRNSHDLEL